jgi:hypothetical protein
VSSSSLRECIDDARTRRARETCDDIVEDPEEILFEKKKFTVLVAAAGPSATGPFGWNGIVLSDGKQCARKGTFMDGTFPRALLRATIRMVRRLPDGCEVEIVSNLDYLVNGINRYFGPDAPSDPGGITELFEIPNGDLWRELEALSQTRELWARRPLPRNPTFARCREIAFETYDSIHAARDSARAQGRHG